MSDDYMKTIDGITEEEEGETGEGETPVPVLETNCC
jgi:hypothetical protein